jgi:hypothetical protein
LRVIFNAGHHQNSIVPGFWGPTTIARARAFTVAAILSMRDEFFDRSGFVNIRLSLLFFVVRATCVPAKNRVTAVVELARHHQLQELRRSDKVATPCRISMPRCPSSSNGTEICR